MGLVEDKVKTYLAAIKKYNKIVNAFLEVRDEKELIAEAKKLDSKNQKGRLYGYVIGVKSNICVKGLHASCASKTLEDYEAPYDATVISSGVEQATGNKYVTVQTSDGKVLQFNHLEST